MQPSTRRAWGASVIPSSQAGAAQTACLGIANAIAAIVCDPGTSQPPGCSLLSGATTGCCACVWLPSVDRACAGLDAGSPLHGYGCNPEAAPGNCVAAPVSAGELSAVCCGA